MIIPEWLTTNALERKEETFRYWFRAAMGLEKIVADEIQEIKSVSRVFCSHRNVLIELNAQEGNSINQLTQIKTADDVFTFEGCYRGIERAKESVEGLIQYFSHFILKQLSTYAPERPVRVTVSFVGKRNFNRFYIENKCNALIHQHTGRRTLSNEIREARQEEEIRLRCHIEDDWAFWGISLQDTPLHRRQWRDLKYPGQLRPTVAAAMARVLKPDEEICIIDPFCGSGTILIEAAQQYPSKDFLGFDLSEEAIQIAQTSVRQAKVHIELKQADSLQAFPDIQTYFLLSNPPWDEKHSLENRQLFIERLSTLIQNSQRSILLLPEDLITLLRQYSEFNIKEIATTRIRGKLAEIIEIG